MYEGGNVYFIRLGNSSQKYVKTTALDKENPKLLIGFDKEVDLEDLNECILKVLLSEEYITEKDPSCYEKYFRNLRLKGDPDIYAPDKAKKALCAFALARPGIDYFITFHEKKMYWGTPSRRPHTLTESTLGQKAGPCFRSRDFEWHDTYVNDKNEDLWSDQVTGIISRINRFQETFYQLHDGDSFSEKKVFFDQINGRLPRIVETAVNKQLGLYQGPIEEDIEEQVNAIVDTQSNTCDHLIQNLCNYLHPSAFEKFVDVAYASQGYLRCSELGGTMKAIDMEYLRFMDGKEPEHIAVQVKSQISKPVLKDTLKTISATIEAMECHIVTHDPNEKGLADVVSKYTGVTDFRFIKLKDLINDSDKRAMLAFLIITLAGRTVLEKLLPELNRIS